jgi:hypothetical protein
VRPWLDVDGRLALVKSLHAVPLGLSSSMWPALSREHSAQEGQDHLAQPLGLLEWKTVAGVGDLFDLQAWVETAQLRRHLERDDGAVARCGRR